MKFSFFYPHGGSGYIRGYQMANYLGGKHNPKSGFSRDICIYVKSLPPKDHPKHTYCDVDDAQNIVGGLKDFPEIGIIAISETAKDYLSRVTKRNDIVCIPHQHVNFEGWVRPQRPVTTVGIIGSKSSFQYPIERFRAMLAEIGLELKYEERYWKTYKSNRKQEMRLNIVDFHKQIDIQAVWRPRPMWDSQLHLRNPNKLGNASAFGIPTVAFPEDSYVREWGGRFAQANSVERIVRICKEFKENERFYRYYAKKALERAKFYHIEHIAQLYRALI